MTWANRITIFRIFCVPIFVTLMLYYAEADRKGSPEEGYRWAAFVVFLIAAISDGIDGFLARHCNQHSALGEVLDPIADKLLFLSSLVVLTHIQLRDFPQFPFWFLVLVITRDVILLLGIGILYFFRIPVSINPHWTGKVSICLLFGAIITFLLKRNEFLWVCYAGGVFTLASTMVYVRDGLKYLKLSGHAG